MARRGVSLDGLSAAMIKDIRRLTEQQVRGVEEAMIDTAYEAAEEMQRIIASPESSTPTGIARGSVGRIDTGAMHDGAGHVDIARGKTQVAARFGYRGASYRDNYPRFQDQGFFHAGAGRWIEGTNALFTAFGKAREKLHERFMALGLRGRGF